MNEILELFQNLTDKDWLLDHHGLYIIMIIVFAETGLFIGFFLPGDYLIFVMGLLLKGYMQPYDNDLINWFYWASLVSACAIIGNYVGYFFGFKSGNWLFHRKDTWYLKKRHLIQAKKFYNRKGGMAIVIARFVPIVRTFAPIVAGVVKMDFRKFTLYNVLGATLWVYGISLVGFLLGTNQWVSDHLEYIIIAIVIVTTGPIIYKMVFGKSVKEATHILPDEKAIESLDEDKIK